MGSEQAREVMRRSGYPIWPAAEAISRMCPNIANCPDLYLDGIEDARGAILSLLTKEPKA